MKLTDQNFFKKIPHRIGLIVNPLFWLGLIYSFCSRFKFKLCGVGFRTKFPLTVTGGKKIKIGKNFIIMSGSYLYANDGELHIGDNCSINSNVRIGASNGKVVIGNGVMIAPNVVIRAANHGIRRESAMRYQSHTYGEIHIEDDVWIGSNAVITSGVTLAKGTVVTAGAVVTKSSEPYSIIAGAPAKRIGDRI